MLRRIVLPGFVAALAMLIGGMIVSLIFAALQPSLRTEYENVEIFRPAADPLMLLYFVHPFVLGFVLAWVWDKTKIVWSYERRWRSSLNFAFCYWMLAIAGMLISYGTFQISLIIVMSWTVSILVQAVIAGLIFSKMNPF